MSLRAAGFFLGARVGTRGAVMNGVNPGAVMQQAHLERPGPDVAMNPLASSGPGVTKTRRITGTRRDA